MSGRGRLYFKHNVEGLLRADSAARGAFYRDLFNVGAITQNEIRALEEMDPIDGGDELYIPLNMIPVSRMDEYFDRLDKIEKTSISSKPEPQKAEIRNV
jgi:hypothetical protein